MTISLTSIRTVATLPTELSFSGKSNSGHLLLTPTITTRVAGQSSDVSKGAKNVGLSHNTTVLLSRTVQRVSSTMTSKTSASVTSVGISFSATTLVLFTPLPPSKMFSHLTTSPAFIRIEATLSSGSSLSGRPNSDQPLLAATTSTRVAGQSPDVRRSEKNVAPSHNNTTVLLSRTIQMLPSTMTSQTDVSVTSVNISYGTTTLALSTPLARSKTFSLLSFSSAEFPEGTAFSPDLYTSRKKVTLTYNSTIMVSRVPTPRIVKTISSFVRSSSAAFSIVDDISKTRAIWGLLSSLFENKISMAKERLPSSINSDVLTTTKRATTNNTIGTSYPFDHSSSMTDVIRSSTTFRLSAFFSGIDTASGFLFHNRTVQQSSLFTIQSRTISLQVMADSENIISERTSFASSHSSEILERSVLLVQSTLTLNTITSLHPLYKSTGNYADVYAFSRIFVSSFNTIKSILPTTKLKPFTTSPADVSSEFNFPRTTISGSQAVTGTLVSPVKTPYIETSRILLSSSFKTFEATIVATDLSAPRTSTSASRNLTRTFSTSPFLQNETITSRTVVSSTISKWKRSTGWFTSSRRRENSFSHVSASVFEYSSRRQSTTTYASHIISSTIQPVSERTFTPHIRIVSTRPTLSKDSSSQSLWITSETSQWAISPTSILVSPSSIYYTVRTEFTPPFQRELYRESASQTRPFKISSVVKSNNVNSITSSGLRTFLPFLTTSNDFSRSTDSPHQAITFLSSAVKNTLSLRTFPSVNKTSSRVKLQTSVGSSLKHKTANTLSVQNFYGHTDDSSREFFNGEIIASGTLNIDDTIRMPTLKLTTVESSQLLSTYPSRVRKSLTSLASSSTGKISLESIIPSTTTPREALSFTLKTKTTLKRTSQTSTEALCTQLSTMLTTLMPFSTLQTARVSMVTRKTVSSIPFMDSWTIRTVVSASPSTGYTLKSASTAPATTQSPLQFFPNFSNDSRPNFPSSSPLLEMSSSQVNVWPTSALRISQKNDQMTTMRTTENQAFPRSLYSRETSALSGSVATERFTFSVKSKSQWTQSATELLVPTSSGKISSTILDMSKSFTTSSHPISSSVSVFFQTGPPPEDPKQFEGTMVLQMLWNLRYLKTYTPEYQALASTIKREISKAFTNLEGFLSVQVLRFWESSVGVDFLVFVRKNANIDENTVERMLTEANNTGVLNVPITSLQVNERRATTTASVPTPVSSKSLEQWVLVLIVAGILVFLLLLIICILAVSKIVFAIIPLNSAILLFSCYLF